MLCESYVMLGRPMLGRPGFPESYVMLGRPGFPESICYVR